MQDRFVCFPPNTTTTKVLLLETGSKSRDYRCIQSELIYHMAVCQPPIMSDSQIPESNKTIIDQTNKDHTFLGYPTMVLNQSGSVRGLSLATSGKIKFSHTFNTSGQIHYETRDTRLSCMAYLRESFTSQEVSAEPADLLLSTWRAKTKYSQLRFFVCKMG